MGNQIIFLRQNRLKHKAGFYFEPFSLIITFGSYIDITFFFRFP